MVIWLETSKTWRSVIIYFSQIRLIDVCWFLIFIVIDRSWHFRLKLIPITEHQLHLLMPTHVNWFLACWVCFHSSIFICFPLNFTLVCIRLFYVHWLKSVLVSITAQFRKSRLRNRDFISLNWNLIWLSICLRSSLQVIFNQFAHNDK